MEPFVGEIKMFGGNFAPQGWAFCNGQVLPIEQYQPLYALIGNRYGGDGLTTFAVPDLRGRIPIHMGTNGSNQYALGQTGGAETVILTPQQLPAHTHVPQANTTGGAASPANNFWANSAINQFTTGATNVTMNANAVSASGNSQAHDNMVPFQALNFIIALEGIFPQRN